MNNIQEQEKRLVQLKQRRQEAVLEGENLKQEYLKLQHTFYETEMKLKTAEEQKKRLEDSGADVQKISHFESEISTLEEAAFQTMAEQESIQISLSDNKTFLLGLEKTFKEIEDEVLAEKKKEQTSIENLDLRLKLLKEELPLNFQELLNKTLSKNLALGSFTRIESGSCFFCRYKISRIEESEIESGQVLKVCPQCTRIFLPFGA